MPWKNLKNPYEERHWTLGGIAHRPILVLAVLFTIFGIISIYSASAVMAFQQYGDSLYFVKRQLLFFVAAWGVYFLVAQVPVVRVAKQRFLLLGFGVLLLGLVLVPGLGLSGGGAQRWLNLGILRIQPAELVRLLLVFYLARTLVIRAPRLKSFNRGFLPLLVVASILMFLLVLQPDFGSAMTILMISVGMWFIGGVPLAYLFGLFLFALPALLFVLFQASYRTQRVLTFLNPWEDVHGAGFQVVQSYIAFFNGGWTGLGLGQGQQKLFYLPKAHTDFVFSVIGEELGLIGVSLVVGLFVALLIFGSQITRLQKSQTGYFLSAGITMILVLPALLNMMVTLGLLPTKGLPLPFFSSGGSSLIVSFIGLGCLQSLYHYRHLEIREDAK